MGRVVIFDMDGLLIDSEPFWRRSHIDVLSEYGISLTQNDVRAMASKRTDEVVHHWRKEHDLRYVSNDELERKVVARVIGSITQKGKALPGVHDLVSLLHQYTIPMAVASSSPPEIIETVLSSLKQIDWLLINNLFEASL